MLPRASRVAACLAAVAALLAAQLSGAADPVRALGPAPDPGCDAAGRQAAPYGVRGADNPPVRVDRGRRTATLVCDATTGTLGMEPMLAVNDAGTIFMGMATDQTVFGDLEGVLTGTATGALLRSRDDGRTWDRLELPEGLWASEGLPYVDPITDRLYMTSTNLTVLPCGAPVIWSDDEGETWHQASKRPGCGPLTIGDWPKVFTGRDVVYLCNYIPDILVATAIGCWRSEDGGATFEFGSFLPTFKHLCKAGNPLTGPGDGIIATQVHGTGQVLPNGDVVVPLTICGTVIVARSTDRAESWEVVDTGGRSGGLKNWLTGLLDLEGGESLAQNIYMNMFFDQTLAQDDAGNLYLAYVRDGVQVAVSRDGGRTWRQLGFVSPPEVRGAVNVSITARGEGEVALAYFGTADSGDPVVGSGERYLGWMAHSRDALARRPVFSTAPTSDLSRPMIVNTLTGCCASPDLFIEYTGVAFTGARKVRAAFVRWTGKKLPELTLGRMTLARR